ncbi:hypothetical protein SK128_025164, partial [Halocaridina rubra]
MATMVRWVALLAVICAVAAVDRNNFKSCQQSSFCRRHRAAKPGESPYSLLVDTVTVSETGIVGDILNEKNKVIFTLEVYPLEDHTLRVKINEKNPIRQRFEEPYAIIAGLHTEKFTVDERSFDGLILSFGESKVVLKAKPLRIDVYKGKNLVISTNARGLLKFEHYRNKPAEGEGENADLQVIDEEEDKDGLWEETFKGHSDSKPNGPSSVGMDISFINSKHVYGIPEHADAFSLKETT